MLADGSHVRLVPELERLVAEEPLRERFRGQLMLALYRAGRQADALATYRDARSYLNEQLGIEPDPELQKLERAILQHDPNLAAPDQSTTGRTKRRTLRYSHSILAVLAGIAGISVAVAIVAANWGHDSARPPATIRRDSVAAVNRRQRQGASRHVPRPRTGCHHDRWARSLGEQPAEPHPH